MPFPSYNDLHAFTPDQRRELQQFVSYLVVGWLQKEHKDDGSHAAITADSLAATGAVSAASVAASGAMTSASLTTSGVVTAGSVSATGAIAAGGAMTAASLVTTGLVTAGTSVTGASFRGGETGSWTPALAFGGASVGLTYSARGGEYLRLASFVVLSMRLALSAKGSSVGNAVITGLPFTLGAVSAGPSMIIDGGSAMAGLTGAPFGFIGGTSINLEQSAATGRAALTDANFTNTTDVRGFLIMLV